MNFLKKLLSWSTSIIIAIVILALLVLHIPQFFGMTPSTVTTNSMKPDFSKGSVVFATEVKAEEVDYGDIISFYYGADKEIVTNKVVDINTDQKYFIAEENGNQAERINENTQKQVPMGDLIGKVKFYMPFIGYVSIILSTTKGKIGLGIVIVLAIISILIPDKKRRLRDSDYDFN